MKYCPLKNISLVKDRYRKCQLIVGVKNVEYNSLTNYYLKKCGNVGKSGVVKRFMFH